MGAEQSNLDELKAKDFRHDYITFFVNGTEYNVKTVGCDPELNPQYMLVDYLRDKLGLTGTKYMCREGGCGACTVTIRSAHPNSGQDFVRSANSCLLPLFACDGMDITTVEGLGNRRRGYTPIQERLVKFGGTQCGFCSPGFVMNMHSMSKTNPRFTSEDVENSLDSNICRCTGYRPILDAFKSLSVNPSEQLKWQAMDIEDIHKCPLKGKPNGPLEPANENLEIVHIPRQLYLRSGSGGEQWVKVLTLSTLFDTIAEFTSSRILYKLVAGNTGQGVFKNDGPYLGFVDINDVPELKQSSLDQAGLTMGGNITLSAAMTLFERASKIEGYVYAQGFSSHFRKIAGVSVRNQGTLGGNLMLKHAHREFASDVFLLLESVGAILRIGSSPTTYGDFNIVDFLNMDMYGKVILSIHLPVYNSSYIFRSFKLGRRYRNTYAYVNGAFLFQVEPKSFGVLSQPRICFGGINPNFVHAKATEKFLEGKPLINKSVLQAAMQLLQDEVIPDPSEDSAPAFRLGLAQSFLYKAILQIVGNAANPRNRSGAYEIERNLSKGTQVFDTDNKKWPLNQPIPKIESFQQVSGEAEYVNDIRPEHGELFGAFVVTTVGNATIQSVDASKALAMPGVVAFLTAKDIPGTNNYMIFHTQPEEIFAESVVRYAGQAVGLLVATSKYVAFEARARVNIKYDNVKKPVVDIVEAVRNANDEEKAGASKSKVDFAFPCKGIGPRKAREIVANITKTKIESDDGISSGETTKVSGEFRMSSQYHFTMETQICICVPTEDGLNVYPSTQSMDIVQAAIASCLNVPNNSISVSVRRLGGGYGAKSSRSALTACACAVAAQVTNRAVRVSLDLETNMKMIGKRDPYLTTYEADVDENGKIMKLQAQITSDGGSVLNEASSLFGMICLQSCYRANGWDIKPEAVSTNTASNTFCRCPASPNGVAAIETIMEHIAYTLKKDPLHVRQVNFIQKGDPFIGVPGAKLPLDNLLPGMLAELKISGELGSRRSYIDSFNQSNRWRKRGLSVVPHRYPNYYWDLHFPTFISVYHVDGSVNISHGGIEMGQGLNTKVAQVVAHTLQVPIESVRVTPSNNLISPNTSISGGSVASELVCSSARRACEQLLERLAPVRRALGNPTWQQLITAANAQEVLLTSQFQEMQGDVTSYDVWGIVATEVEIDVLTGDFKIVRVDLIEDAGTSISPLVDIGQIEGAFVMGLGWWLTEQLVYNPSDGVLLSDNTWTYKPMLASDIPEDFRTTLCRGAKNPFGVLGSKATGEPPLSLSCSAIFAIRNAIDSARREIGNYSWYQMDGPVTREVIRHLCLTSFEQFSF